MPAAAPTKLEKLAPHPTIEKPAGPVLVCILDGVGEGPKDAYDAVAMAETPCLDALRAVPGRFRTVRAHGTAVGLPSDDDMGNSEVGHNALGCGRVVLQGASLVDQAIKSGAIFEGPTWRSLLERATAGGTVHFIGLLSDGGVHSRLDQLVALLRRAAGDGAKRLRVHVLTDGRDVPDQTALRYVDELEVVFEDLRHDGVDARIASGGGRMHVTMDRYEADWRIVERGWRAHVLGDGPGFASVQEAIETARADDPAVSDQYLPPFVIEEDGEPVGQIVDGDAVICFNYRGDRVIEISRAFEEASFAPFDRIRLPDVLYAGMMQYDGDLQIPKRYLVEPPTIDRTSGEYLAISGVRTFAGAETHKFGHVTYFWNGNRSGAFDKDLETYDETPSDPRPFREAPAMRAEEVTDAICAALRSGRYDMVRVNIANGDMIGHTGDLAATIEAMQVTDHALSRMLEAVDEVNGRFLVTADHGNADDMVQRNKDGTPKLNDDGAPIARTSHTLAAVPVCIGGAGLQERIGLRSDLPAAGLANLAATSIELLGLTPPHGYEPSLLVEDRTR